MKLTQSAALFTASFIAPVLAEIVNIHVYTDPGRGGLQQVLYAEGRYLASLILL